MSNDQHGNHWPDHGHESKWPSDACGDGPGRSGWGRGPGLLWSLLIACLVVGLLVGSEYLVSLGKQHEAAVHAEEQRRKEQDAMKQGANALGEMLQGFGEVKAMERAAIKARERALKEEQQRDYLESPEPDIDKTMREFRLDIPSQPKEKKQ